MAESLNFSNTVAFNAIFFQLEGEIVINWGEHKDVSITPGNMYFLPRGATVTAYIASEYISYVVVRLEHNIENSKGFALLSKYKKHRALEAYKFAPLPMNSTMSRFVDSVHDYLHRGVQSPQLSALKVVELQTILRWYYSMSDCIRLLGPMVSSKTDFEQFILDNYHTSTTVDELVSKANMSRSTFDRKFKVAFNITPLKWIEDHTRQKIIQKASEPNVTVKDVMYEVEVYNPSQFTKLCKRLCGVTPSELIRRS